MKGGQYTKREGGMWSFCCVGYRVAPSSDPADAGPPSPRGEGYGICGVVGELGLVFHNSG